MAHLTGPYAISLDHLLATSLWMDLSDVLVWYRTIAERLGHLKRPARRGLIAVPEPDVQALVSQLNAELLPLLSSEPVRNLANTVLHQSWHPNGAGGLALTLSFTGSPPDVVVDFVPGGFWDSLTDLVVRTVEDSTSLIERLV
jgi:hypothetical protein